MEAKGKMASPVAQAGSLPCRRLVVGGAPICNRKLISSRARVARLVPRSCQSKSLNTNDGRAKSCSVVGRGEATTKNSKLKMWMSCFVLFKSLAHVNLTA